MDDLIRRSKALDLVCTQWREHTEPTKRYEMLAEALEKIVEGLREMPSAQPDCTDCIWDVCNYNKAISAQPEIIRCKDCKNRYIDCPMHYVEWTEYEDDGYIETDDTVYDYTEDYGFCHRAEREDNG